MAFTEDLTDFLDLDGFAVEATPSVGEAIPVIFDRAHIDAMVGQTSATNPMALAKTADVAAFVIDTTTLVIAGATYAVRDLHPDGAVTLLILEAA